MIRSFRGLVYKNALAGLCPEHFRMPMVLGPGFGMLKVHNKPTNDGTKELRLILLVLCK